jgi:RNA polymerase sigma-70 factor (ECF subfamily)
MGNFKKKHSAISFILGIIKGMTKKKKASIESVLTIAHQDYERVLRSYALSRVHNRDTSEDLVQDTFIKTWTYLVKGGQVKLMKSFLYRILNNLIVDEYRKHKTTSFDALHENGYDPGTDETDKMIDTLDSKVIPSLLEQLPPTYKKILRMRYMESRSLQEISFATHRSTNTVSVQVHRGLTMLKDLYGLSV